MKKTYVNSEKAPAPIGPYSQAVQAEGKLMFISGQIPFTAAGELIADDIQSQTKQSIENIKAILEEAGLSLDNVVKTTVLLDDMGNFASVNEVYAQYFSESKPARAAYQVSRLPKDVKIEIEAIAVF